MRKLFKDNKTITPEDIQNKIDDLIQRQKDIDAELVQIEEEIGFNTANGESTESLFTRFSFLEMEIRNIPRSIKLLEEEKKELEKEQVIKDLDADRKRLKKAINIITPLFESLKDMEDKYREGLKSVSIELEGLNGNIETAYNLFDALRVTLNTRFPEYTIQEIEADILNQINKKETNRIESVYRIQKSSRTMEEMGLYAGKDPDRKMSYGK